MRSTTWRALLEFSLPCLASRPASEQTRRIQLKMNCFHLQCGMQKLPPLVELRAFDAAARHLSFKKAATELGVTPTPISHQIRQLERYCGRALFRRRPRPLSLTDAGARLFPVIREGLESFVTAFAAVKRDMARQPILVTT